MGQDNKIELPFRRKTNARSLSPSIHWAQRHYRGPDELMSRRIYDFELLYIENGEVEAQIGVNGMSFLVQSGSLLLLPAGIYHRVEAMTKKSTTLLGIHFDFFDEMDIQRDQDIIVDERQIHHNRFCYMPDLEAAGGMLQYYFLSPPSELVSLMEYIIREFTEKSISYEISCKGILLQIISLLFKEQQVQRRHIQSPHKESFLQLTSQIRESCAEDWPNSRMAYVMNMHEDYMAKLFKSLFGLSPNKYVQSVRHQEAKRLIRETDNKVEFIGRQVGYPDVHYFSRIFLKWEGIHASEYRKLSRLL